MKKFLLSLTILIMLQPLSGVAEAAYMKTSDKKVSVNTGLNLSIPFNTGETSFKLQEAVHKQLFTTTGLEVDYYYIWLELDGKSILAIDPARVMY
jgi:hypothetical protein